jgi:hypothetical protein
LFAERLSQTFRGPAFLSTNGIWLGTTFLTGKASEASFVHDEFNWMFSSGSLAFLPHPRIMDLHTRFLTMGAGCLSGRGDHFDSKRAIRPTFLLENMQFRQISWHDASFSSDGFFCDMLTWQGLFSLT